MGGKDEAPKGPDFNKLIKLSGKYARENNKIFKEAMTFGKDQFSKGEEWVQKLTDFGMDAQGKLNSQADAFGKAAGERVASLDKQGADWGKAATDIYGENKQLASDVTGKLMPGMGAAASQGADMLESYGKEGIKQQNEYMAKLGGWDSAARREGRAAEGVSDFRLASTAAEEEAQRKLIGYGIDPGQVVGASLTRNMMAQRAVAEAQIMNQGRRDVEAEGITHGKTASEMWDTRREGGIENVESAASTGRTIAEVARQPGADYMSTLANLGSFKTGVGTLEQAGGRSEFDMRSNAAGFGERGTTAGATQHNTNANYGSALYDQAGRGVKQGFDIRQGAYNTAGALNANDIARVSEANKNSFGGQIGQLAGVAAPFVLDAIAPGVGSAFKAATGVGAAAAAPVAATPYGFSATPSASGPFAKYAREGRIIKPQDSPSFGIIPDDVDVKATPGEAIVDPETVSWFGEKYFHDLKAKAKKGRGGIPEAAAA